MALVRKVFSSKLDDAVAAEVAAVVALHQVHPPNGSSPWRRLDRQAGRRRATCLIASLDGPDRRRLAAFSASPWSAGRPGKPACFALRLAAGAPASPT